MNFIKVIHNGEEYALDEVRNIFWLYTDILPFTDCNYTTQEVFNDIYAESFNYETIIEDGIYYHLN